MQVAIEASLGDTSSMQLSAVAQANEQVSTILHQNRLAQALGKYVVHLQFSRPCKALHDILFEYQKIQARTRKAW